jgi:ribosomal protein S18 acetylase RimI-like enzyme
VATAADAGGIARTLALAFEHDPLWSWALPGAGRVQRIERLWRLYIDNALHYRWTFTSADYEATSVWIPPGGTELSSEGEAELEPLVSELTGGDPGPVLALFEALEAAHPHAPPHYYLSLLGTHPQSRGRGLGMAMVREVLERIDAEHMPAYLESSLPANDRRYASVGFVRTGEVNAPGGPTATTMWRAAR